MAFAQLEDFRGSIELILFSDVYERTARADRQRRASSASGQDRHHEGGREGESGRHHGAGSAAAESRAGGARPAAGTRWGPRRASTRCGNTCWTGGGLRAVLPRGQRERRRRRPSCRPRRRSRVAGRRRGARPACASTRRWRTYGQSEDRPGRLRHGRGRASTACSPATRQEFARRLGVGDRGALGRRARRLPKPRRVGPGTRVVSGWREILDDPSRAHRRGARRRRGGAPRRSSGRR